MNEDQLYAQVAMELESNALDKGLWLRAQVECNGDFEKAKIAYVKLRMERLLEENNAYVKLRMERLLEEKKARLELERENEKQAKQAAEARESAWLSRRPSTEYYIGKVVGSFFRLINKILH